jgi:hypothetical protein
MSLIAIRAALESALNGMSPALSTNWENTAFVPVQGTPYQRAREAVGARLAGSTGSQYMRRVHVHAEQAERHLRLERDRQPPAVDRRHEGPGSRRGTLNGELSPGHLRAGVRGPAAPRLRHRLHRDHRRVADHRGSGPTYTVTRASGSFLTDGVKKGMVVRLSVGSLNAANISKNLLVLGDTATVLTVKPLNGVALVAEGPITGCTVSAPGKETHAPTTGHTNDYFSWEKKFTDLTRYELFTDVKPASRRRHHPGHRHRHRQLRPWSGLGRTLGGRRP